jgi:hypothetical protein
VLCLPWWQLILIVTGAAALGFVLCFGWYWWLLSRPGVRR